MVVTRSMTVGGQRICIDYILGKKCTAVCEKIHNSEVRAAIYNHFV